MSVLELAEVLPPVAVEPLDHTLPLPTSVVPPVGIVPFAATMPPKLAFSAPEPVHALTITCAVRLACTALVNPAKSQFHSRPFEPSV